MIPAEDLERFATFLHNLQGKGLANGGPDQAYRAPKIIFSGLSAAKDYRIETEKFVREGGWGRPWGQSFFSKSG